jgi:Lrp/AsnC family leucine-responsive transcriptional regulator
MPLDKFDLAILAVLQQDARASLQEISSRVGLTSTPCWTRIKKMESDGVIQGYSVRLDPVAIGFTETVIVQVTLDNHHEETLEAFGKALEAIPEVLEAYLVSGDYDYHIRIAVRDTRAPLPHPGNQAHQIQLRSGLSQGEPAAALGRANRHQRGFKWRTVFRRVRSRQDRAQKHEVRSRATPLTVSGGRDGRGALE